MFFALEWELQVRKETLEYECMIFIPVCLELIKPGTMTGIGMFLKEAKPSVVRIG